MSGTAEQSATHWVLLCPNVAGSLKPAVQLPQVFGVEKQRSRCSVVQSDDGAWSQSIGRAKIANRLAEEQFVAFH